MRSTSSRPMASTRISPSTGSTRFAIPRSQLDVVLLFRQRARFASNVRSAASRNVGALVRRLAASGSPPRRASRRFSNAASRASRSVTSGNPPRPMSWRLPSMASRWIQLFDPPGAMFRNSVPPSPCRPGFVRPRTIAAFSFPMAAFPHVVTHESRGTTGYHVKPDETECCRKAPYLRAFTGICGAAGKQEMVPEVGLEPTRGVNPTGF